jgi:uncharacterized protein YecE (DUF72 family)
MEIKVGTCGFGERKSKYFKDFKVVEIQETFYQPANFSKYEKWRKEAPKDFEFVVKVWQLITHEPSSPTYKRLKIKISKKENYGFFKNKREIFEAWEIIDKICQILRAKIVLFQTPASFEPKKENKENLENFFKKIKRRDYIFVWEPRGKWEKKEIEEICKKLNLVHCVDPFKEKPVFGKINYFRLHGLNGKYNLKYKYTIKDLLQLKNFCNKAVNYVLFNNLFMVENAKMFQRMI